MLFLAAGSSDATTTGVQTVVRWGVVHLRVQAYYVVAGRSPRTRRTTMAKTIPEQATTLLEDLTRLLWSDAHQDFVGDKADECERIIRRALLEEHKRGHARGVVTQYCGYSEEQYEADLNKEADCGETKTHETTAC
jgi:hypothetical protein